MNTVISLFAQTTRSATHAPSCNERCAHCPSSAQCWSAGGETKTGFRFARRRVKRGQTLYRMGEPFHSLYSVRSGTLKSRTLLEDGRDQVTGFHMNGELLGIDGIGSQLYQTDCIALEDSEVCILPYEQVLSMAHSQPQMMSGLYRTMSQEIVREQGLMALLGSMQADERVAAFLLNLSLRLQERGFSAACFLLRMTREEIGSYLGLKLETVSRVFSRLQAAGHIKVESNRQITILNAAGLKNFSAANASREIRPASHPRRAHAPVRAFKAPVVRPATPAPAPARAYG
ncbi:MAG: helix-turn-helix domain-containing protein [Burkholderiales bacterium]